jgi:hypothetical protein
MKLKKDLQVRLAWENNKGYYYGPVANFPLANGFKTDFDLRISVVENVDDSSAYDMYRVDVENLKVFMQDNSYVTLKGNQERNLIDSINEKVMW